MQNISQSRSLTQHEGNLNNLISNMLIYLLKIHSEGKTPQTPTEQLVVNYLKNLTEKGFTDIVELMDIINSGVVKKLNKFITLDVVINHNVDSYPKKIPNISIEYIPISKAEMYRKITKKLKSDDIYLLYVKDLFQSYYKDLCFLVDAIIDDVHGFNSIHYYANIDNCLNETEYLIKVINLDIVSKFTTSAILISKAE